VQFDLRFYVVALLFIIFDVEVALFFPWATVFGKAVELTDPSFVAVQADGATLTPAAAGVMKELGIREPAVPAIKPDPAVVSRLEATRGDRSLAQAEGQWSVARAGGLLARTAVVDMAAFFAVLLVGFAYVWSRGDLDWVRAVSAERAAAK
jgi:NADH-quinone oxidoreductase subunit A